MTNTCKDYFITKIKQLLEIDSSSSYSKTEAVFRVSKHKDSEIFVIEITNSSGYHVINFRMLKSLSEFFGTDNICVECNSCSGFYGEYSHIREYSYEIYIINPTENLYGFRELSIARKRIK